MVKQSAGRFLREKKRTYGKKRELYGIQHVQNRSGWGKCIDDNHERKRKHSTRQDGCNEMRTKVITFGINRPRPAMPTKNEGGGQMRETKAKVKGNGEEEAVQHSSITGSTATHAIAVIVLWKMRRREPGENAWGVAETARQGRRRHLERGRPVRTLRRWGIHIHLDCLVPAAASGASRARRGWTGCSWW
jgi:hypothetical protein